MRMPAVALVALLAFATGTDAQDIAGTVSPSAVLPGSVVTLTITEATGVGVVLAHPCGFEGVAVGGPGGSLIAGSGCAPANTPLGPHASLSGTWNVSGFGPGRYAFRVRYQDANNVQRTEWFCFDVAYPFFPTLTAVTNAQVGQPLDLRIDAPNFSGVPYLVAAARTSNAGFFIAPGQHVCLDPDAVFALSFPVPHPALFSGFQGVLDATGEATGITVHIPNLPALRGQPLRVQAVLVPLVGAASLTNPLSFSVAL